MIGPYSVFNLTHGNATTHRAVRIAAMFVLALTSGGAAVAPTSAVAIGISRLIVVTMTDLSHEIDASVLARALIAGRATG
ncbi:MAG: hypothetical protein NTX09_08540, partial [Verrucomicrobia bacterium]|nr:hypothetical protein [Verrucomicrobiota bacterium]